MLSIESTVLLPGNIKMPRFGLGVYLSKQGKETRQAVLDALDFGYRHIDTAAIYENEEDVGLALRESKIPREQIFVTTKLWNGDQGYESALEAFEQSLRKLQLDYIDLYLLHWPVPTLRNDSWRALETLLQQGKCRAIGVSNFLVNHLTDLLQTANVTPMVNQIEASPFLTQIPTREFCKKHQIYVEAYSPLTKGRRLNEPILREIASSYQKTPAQILIRWALENDMIVIPKSVRKERILENASVFDFSLSQEHLHRLNQLNEDAYTGWDPRRVS